MTNITLLLGPIAFTDFERPAVVRFGGSQRVAIHRLPGGGRVVDTMGPDDADIIFAGIISGSDAAARALEIDALRVAGLPLPLTWDSFFYLVVLREFQADYTNPGWIPYRITCAVVQSAVDLVVGAATTLLSAAASDLGAAAGFAAPENVDLAGAQAAIAAPGATTLGTASYAGAQSSLASAQTGIGSGIASASTVIDGLAGGTTLLGTTSPVTAVGNLNAATAAAGTLGQLSAAQAYAGRAAVNLTNAST